jgi:cytochrome c5
MLCRFLFRLSIIPSVLALTACGDPQLKLGEEVFNGSCIACHTHGFNGAPILGNNKMWSKRVGQGEETLIEHAKNGYGLMPANGGKRALTHDDIAAGVKYMLSKLEE